MVEHWFWVFIDMQFQSYWDALSLTIAENLYFQQDSTPFIIVDPS